MLDIAQGLKERSNFTPLRLHKHSFMSKWEHVCSFLLSWLLGWQLNDQALTELSRLHAFWAYTQPKQNLLAMKSPWIATSILNATQETFILMFVLRQEKFRTAKSLLTKSRIRNSLELNVLPYRPNLANLTKANSRLQVFLELCKLGNCSARDILIRVFFLEPFEWLWSSSYEIIVEIIESWVFVARVEKANTFCLKTRSR